MREDLRSLAQLYTISPIKSPTRKTFFPQEGARNLLIFKQSLKKKIEVLKNICNKA